MTHSIFDFSEYKNAPQRYQSAFIGLGIPRLDDYVYGRCLGYILGGLHWKGEIWHLMEAFPHYAEDFDEVYLANTITNLGYATESMDLCLDHIDARLLPCLFIPDNDKQAPLVILAQQEGKWEVFNAKANELQIIDASILASKSNFQGKGHFFKSLDKEKEYQIQTEKVVPASTFKWFLELIYPMRSQLGQGLILTAMITVMTLFSSIYIMNVYDKVVYIHSEETLLYLFVGILIIVACDYTLRETRLRIFSWFGIRLEVVTAPQIFRHILRMPARLMESGNIPSQMSKLKDFDAIRNFCSGSLILTLLEVPFLLIMLLALYAMGGPLVIVPIFMSVLLLIFLLFLIPMVKRTVQETAVHSTRRYNMIVNTMNKLKYIQLIGNVKPIFDQFRIVSGNATMANYRNAGLNALLESLGYAIYVIAGCATMGYGVHLVMTKTITSGALIGCMILVWRLLGPIQTCVSSISVFIHFKMSVIQTHQLLSLPTEEKITNRASQIPLEAPTITLSNILMRHHNHSSVVFNGLNLTIEAGELLMIAGQNSSGKTTFLRMLNGIYFPQSGNIRLNNIDIRQFDVSEYRRNIGYVPERTDVFFGTVLQNLYIANPAASIDEVESVLKRLGCYNSMMAFEKGLHHHLEEFKSNEISDSFKYQLSLARAILRDPILMLIDEAPYNFSNSDLNNHLLDYLKEWHGKKTVVMVAKCESMLRQADRILYLLGDGRAVIGQPDEIIDFMKNHTTAHKSKRNP